jgi:hypothetical protein
MDAGASTRLPENDVGRDGGGADGGDHGGGARIAGAGPAAGATWNGVRRSLESGAET